jgi:hypothetical protein
VGLRVRVGVRMGLGSMGWGARGWCVGRLGGGGGGGERGGWGWYCVGILSGRAGGVWFGGRGNFLGCGAAVDVWSLIEIAAESGAWVFDTVDEAGWCGLSSVWCKREEVWGIIVFVFIVVELWFRRWGYSVIFAEGKASTM